MIVAYKLFTFSSYLLFRRQSPVPDKVAGQQVQFGGDQEQFLGSGTQGRFLHHSAGLCVNINVKNISMLAFNICIVWSIS